MDWAALFKIVQSWGPSAISSVLVVVVLFLIKQVHKNSADNEQRAKDSNILIDSKLKELRNDTFKMLDDHGRRLSYIELEYVRRESFYRELGGWKDDINRVSGQISDFNKSVIELWRDKRGQ
ncbi:MAG: hypothetical protein LBI04_08670 [Treponema sp.]|jgi:hypothetical protein|nr:hypothetical protein [Treponema sp.]